MQINLFHLQTRIGKQLGADLLDVVELVIIFMFFQMKKTNISNSFRIRFIIQLWQKTSKIKFVRQAIGHRKLDSTSSYVENLSDENRIN
jgi:hypothetical protein